MKKYRDISVVTPAWNEESRIENLLNGLLDQDEFPKEVIIVDNNSSDNTVKIIKSYNKKFSDKKISFILLHNPDPGVAKTRNIGFYQAKYPIIASIDADTIPAKNWISEIFNHFQKNPNDIGVAGKIIMADAPKIFKIATELGWYQFYYFIVRVFFGFQILSTGNSAYKKTAFVKVGGFDNKRDETNKLDDVELASRLSLIGKTNYNEKILTNTSFRRYSTPKKALHAGLARFKEIIRIEKAFIAKKRQLKTTS